MWHKAYCATLGAGYASAEVRQPAEAKFSLRGGTDPGHLCWSSSVEEGGNKAVASSAGVGRYARSQPRSLRSAAFGTEPCSSIGLLQPFLGKGKSLTLPYGNVGATPTKCWMLHRHINLLVPMLVWISLVSLLSMGLPHR